jgi:hypothetical protein
MPGCQRDREITCVTPLYSVSKIFKAGSGIGRPELPTVFYNRNLAW